VFFFLMNDFSFSIVAQEGYMIQRNNYSVHLRGFLTGRFSESLE